MILTMISYFYIRYHNQNHTNDIEYDITYDMNYDIIFQTYDIIVHIIPGSQFKKNGSRLKKTDHGYDILVRL
jgi:hypothetical protein